MMRHSRSRGPGFGFAAVAALSSLWSMPAAAPYGAKGVVLEKRVGTSRRREATRLEVPLSIAALSAAQLERHNLHSDWR